MKGLPTRLVVGVVTSGPAPWLSGGAVWLAPGLPLHTQVFQGADGSHSCITPEQVRLPLARRTDSVCARVGMALRAQGGKAGPHPALLTSHLPACFPYRRTIFPKPQMQSQLDLILATFLMAKPGFCY